MRRLVIFANGLLPDVEAARRVLQPGDIYHAADGGTQHALALGVLPSRVIGDLDSLTQGDRQLLQGGAVEIQQFPRDKNDTDLELAIAAALRDGYRRMVVVGALGGRLDQALGNLALLGSDRLADCDIRFDDGVEEVFFTRARCVIHGISADLVSLIPWGGVVTGITTLGLRWPLQGESLFPQRTRGISNEMMQEEASITLGSGLLLVIHRRQNRS